MGIFDKLFGLKKKVSGKDVKNSGLSEHMEFLDTLRKFAVRFDAADNSVFNKIGGLPMANDSLKWPVWMDNPLSFLCQIDLATIAGSGSTNDLPKEGLLYFFYDQEQQTWGFDPEDRDSWRVIYIKEKSNLKPVNAPDGLEEDSIYNEKWIKFTEIQTYPDWQDDRIDKLNLNDTQSDKYIDLCSSVFENNPAHHLLGYPAPVQGNDMDLECQLASNGLYCGDETGFNNPKSKLLEPGRDDWILLLQLDSDEDADIMWGDSGRLYFWIRKDDLKNEDFNNVWMILQCA